MSAERRGTATQGDEPIGSYVEKREEGHVGGGVSPEAGTDPAPTGSERPLHPAGCRGCVTGLKPRVVQGWVPGCWLECG